MNYLKNTIGKWRIFAYDSVTGAPILGDAVNITAKVSKDFGLATALTDVNPVETEDGYYVFDLTAAERNADTLNLYPESSTANVVVMGDPPTQFAHAFAYTGIWYVDGAAIGNGSGLDPANAFTTIAAAIAAAISGETIHIADGTYAESVDLVAAGLTGVTLRGVSLDTIISTSLPSGIVVKPNTDTTMRRLKVENTATTGQAVNTFNVAGLKVYDCDLEGTTDAIACTIIDAALVPCRYEIKNTRMKGTFDGGVFSGLTGLLMEDSILETDSTSSAINTNALKLSNLGSIDCTATLRRCKIRATRGVEYAGNSTVESIAANIGGTGTGAIAVRMENCTATIETTDATDTGEATGLSLIGAAADSAVLELQGCAIASTMAGAGTVLDIKSDGVDGPIHLANTKFDSAKLSGTAIKTVEQTARIEMDSNSTELAAAKTASQSADGKLPADTATKIGLITTMRGTDGANTTAPNTTTPLDATATQAAAEAAILAKLPAGKTEVAAAGATAKDLDGVSGGGTVVETRDLEEPQFVWELKSRSIGEAFAPYPLRIVPGETVIAGFDCDVDFVLPEGTVLATMSADPLTLDPDPGTNITATKVGIGPRFANVSIAAPAGAVVGTEAWLEVEVTNSRGNGPTLLVGRVLVVAKHP